MDRVGDRLPDAIEQNGGKRNERSGARPSIDVKEEQKKGRNSKKGKEVIFTWRNYMIKEDTYYNFLVSKITYLFIAKHMKKNIKKNIKKSFLFFIFYFSILFFF